MWNVVRVCSLVVVCLIGAARVASAQLSAPPSWMLMQDGVVYGLFNQQGGPRGGDEFVVPNWWMGM